MKYLLFLLLLFVGCQQPVVKNHPPIHLTDEDRAMVNYTTGDSIPFIHSSGVEFTLYVDTVYEEVIREYRTSPALFPQDIECYTTKLSSDYPYLNIQISIFPQSDFIYPSVIIVNSSSFMLDYNWNEPQSEQVTVTFNGTTYENVYSHNNNDYYGDAAEEESESIFMSSLIYSKEYGILQIGKSNGETFTINR